MEPYRTEVHERCRSQLEASLRISQTLLTGLMIKRLGQALSLSEFILIVIREKQFN